MLGGDYAKGVGVLAHTLKSSGAKYPLYCMYTNDVPADTRLFLSAHVDKMVLVPKISHESVPLKTNKQREIYGGWIAHSYTKWNCLNPSLFPGVSQLVFIDADAIVRRNPDKLFDVDGVAGVFATPWATPYNKSKHAMKNPYVDAKKRPPKHGQVITKQQLRAGLTGGFVMDASLVLIIPDTQAYQCMNRILADPKAYGFPESYAGNDEQLLGDIMLQSASGPYSRPCHLDPSWSCHLGKEDIFSPGVPVKISQYYNEKPWDGILSRADRDEMLANAKYPDLAEWWDIVDKIVSRDPLAEEIYFPSDAYVTKTGSSEQTDMNAFLDSLI